MNKKGNNTRSTVYKVLFSTITVLFAVFAVLSACGENGSGGSSGRGQTQSEVWVRSDRVHILPMEYRASIEFNGNNFTTTTYWHYMRTGLLRHNDTPSFQPSGNNVADGFFTFYSNSNQPMTRSNAVLEEHIGTVTVSKEDSGPDGIYGDFNVGYRLTHRGTFSISDDRIEFVFSDGSIAVLAYQRTENTLTIGGTSMSGAQFVRKP
jgi:hypothetical protein